MSGTQKNLLTCGIAIIILAIFGVGFFFALEMRARAEMRKAYGEDTLALCSPPVTTDPDMRNFPTTVGPYKSILIGIGEDTIHDWQDLLPAEVQAKNRAELDLVFCVGEIRDEVVEECPYYNETGYVFGVRRFQPFIPVGVINPQTNRLIAELKVIGGPPRNCEARREDERNTITNYDGVAPNENAFIRAIWEYLYRDISGN